MIRDVGSQQHFANEHSRSLNPSTHGILYGSATAELKFVKTVF